MPLYSMCYIRTAQYLRLVLLYILTRSAPARRNMLPLPSPEKCNALPWDIRPHRRLREPLVQRLHSAQATLTALSSSPSTAGTPAVQALHATLTQALQLHRGQQPRM